MIDAAFFDRLVDRKNTDCVKWDLCDLVFKGKDLNALWVADMDFECPPSITEALKRRIEHPLYGYTFVNEKLKEDIVSWQKKRHNWDIQKDDLSFGSGIVPSLICALHAFSNPGDKIIIQTPVYHPFYEVITKNGRTLQTNPLILKEGRYEMDFDQLQAVIKGAKIFILCNPHNPGGRSWTKEELSTLATICLEHNVLLVSDEIHSDIIYSKSKHTPLGSLKKELADNAITLMSPSKTFNIAGLMFSFAIISNPHVRQKFELMREALGHKSLNPFALVCSEAAYSEGEEWLCTLLQYLEANRDFIDIFIKNRLPQIKHILPEATYLTWLDMNGLKKNEDEIKDLLVNKAKLALNDGKMFGKEGTLFRRLNFASPRIVIENALYALEHSLTN